MQGVRRSLLAPAVLGDGVLDGWSTGDWRFGLQGMWCEKEEPSTGVWERDTTAPLRGAHQPGQLAVHSSAAPSQKTMDRSSSAL